MAALRLGLGFVLLSWHGPLAADPIDRWRPIVAAASSRFNIPEDWILRVIRSESGGRTQIGGRPIVSPAGAMGLMQLMPGTWADMRARHALGSNPHDPADNIMAGTAYLSLMRQRFGYPGLFAAYHSGPGRYQRHLATGDPLPRATLAYVESVLGNARDRAGFPFAGRPASPSERQLFVLFRGPSSIND